MAVEDDDFQTTTYFDANGDQVTKSGQPAPAQKKPEPEPEPEIEVKEDDTDDEEFEVEVVDDTPEEDRGRDPLPDDIKKNLEVEESAEEYSKKVKERMNQLRKAWHDERRAREEAERQNQEYTNVTQEMHRRLQGYEKQLSEGESWALEQARKRAELEVQHAKRLYAEAYEEGDTNKIVEAQEAMSRAITHFDRTHSMQPRFQGLQKPQEEVYNQPQQQPTQQPKPQVDPKAQAWADENAEWFGKDDEMTSFALGVHKRLVEGGTPPDTDEYYEALDARMREVFPSAFKSDEPEDPPKKEKQQSPTVVAPASRTPKGGKNKVVLTKSQLAIAKKIGVSPEQYAREVRKLNGGN